MLLTKQLFKAMDTVYNEANYDMLNLSKLVWKDGITATIVLGNKAQIFTALPEHYTVTDFDIHIEDSAKSFQDRQALMTFSGELIRGGAADLEDITNIMTASGMTELKRTLDRSIAKKKEENSLVGQLQQQVQQYEQTVKGLEKSMQQLQNENQQLNQQLERNSQIKLDLEAQRVAIEKEKVRNTKEYNDKVIETKQQEVQAQVAQMYDASPYNDKIKSVI
jgi:chromosome segregation ATPase